MAISQMTLEIAGALRVARLIGGTDKLQAFAQGYILGATGAYDWDEALKMAHFHADNEPAAQLKGAQDFLDRATRSPLTRAVGKASSVVNELQALIGRQRTALEATAKPKPVSTPAKPKARTAVPKASESKPEPMPKTDGDRLGKPSTTANVVEGDRGVAKHVPDDDTGI